MRVQCDLDGDLQLDEDRLLMPLYRAGIKSTVILIWNFAQDVYAMWNHSPEIGHKV
jgi:hypothetical protein